MNFSIVIVIFTCFAFDEIKTLAQEQSEELFNNESESVDDAEIDLTDLENTMYGFPSEETGKRVAMWREEDGVNPEELGEYAQGDILFSALESRSGLRSKRFRWPKARVPYMISPVFDPAQRSLILQAMAEIEANTCVVFIPRTGEDGYIRIQSAKSGCWSSVGFTGSRIDMNLQRPGCVTKKGTVEHELMHCLGFVHEQSRDDRDENVLIQRENIKPGSEVNFQKYSSKTINNFGKRYDYGSVMHYSPYAFSVNGRPTIIARNNNYFMDGDKNHMMGQREGLSSSDIEKINRMYDCYEYLKVGQAKMQIINSTRLTYE